MNSHHARSLASLGRAGNDAVLSAMFHYPVKSMRGIALSTARALPRGFPDDRRWMVVDADGRYVTQRSHPRMALIAARLEEDEIVLSLSGMPDLRVRARGHELGAPLREVTIWADTCAARSLGERAARWLGDALGIRCDLVHMPDDTRRPVDPRYAASGDIVGFADGFPYLLTTEASLAALNAALAAPVPMDRFRPNLVVSGTEAFAEDGWTRITVGGTAFRVAKPCGRCVITTVDQATGEKGTEPLKTLATFRKRDEKVLFGQNLIPDGEGTLSIGDGIAIS
jgi:uncharacterized protein YcbX